MLIDDEPIILEKLQNVIDWEKENCRIVAVADNGAEAMNLCRDLKPQIIFSDIYMPLMDGLELAEEIKILLPESLVILISGYNEFAYAQKAIEAGVFRYLLKPIRAGELSKILAEAKSRLTERRQATEEKIRLQNLIKKNLPGLREKFFVKLINGQLGPEDLKEQLAFLEIKLQGEWWGTILFHLDNYPQLAQKKKEAELQFYQFHLLELIKKRYTAPSFLYSLIHRPAEIVLLYGLTEPGEEKKLYETTLFVQDEILKADGVSFSAGFGGLYPELVALERSYQEALLALEFKVWTGANALIPYRDIENSKSGRLLHHREQETFSSLLRGGNREKILGFIQQIFTTLKTANYLHMPKSYLLLTVLDLVNQIIRSLLEFNGSLEEIYGPAFDPVREINNFETLDQLQTWLEKMAWQAVAFINDHKQKVGRNFVEKAREYIEENFHDPDLNLEKVADQVYVSSCYLSRLFKEVTAYSFTEYLNRRRVSAAEKLLLTTGAKIYEIAEAVGFRDSHYFGIVFKKITGLAPSDYRDQIRSNPFA
jgi:two-component system response regulator YesN